MSRKQTTMVFEQLGRALDRLEAMVAKPVDGEGVNIDATIQRFEFTFELFWRYLQKRLSDEGIEARFPREVLQESYRGRFVDDEATWLAMLYDRDRTSHTYDETLANEV